MRRLAALAMTLVMLFFLCSCGTVSRLIAGPTEATVRPRMTVTPAPTLNNTPAYVYQGVETDQRVVSLVFEGFTDAKAMSELVTLLSQRKVKSTFFLSGATAADFPDTLNLINDAGFVIGNYGITAKKKMQNETIEKNMHQFTRTQELIQQACGVTPSLFRCNGTEYTREVLQAAAASGLYAGVEPSFYLNHRSFSAPLDAAVYVRRLFRGGIISVKLGQELDVDEFGDGGWKNPEKPAYDPPPRISDDVDELAISVSNNIGPVITWLLDALEAEGFKIVPLEQLQTYAVNLLGTPRTLDEAEKAVFSTEQYVMPVTREALSAGESYPGTEADFEGCVFVGDSIAVGLQDYVEWRRESEPDYLAGARFLTNERLSVETALGRLSAESIHPEYNGMKITIENGLAAMRARRVYLMLRCNDNRAYASEEYLQNYKLLIHLIKMKNPDIEVCVLSLPPGMGDVNQRPTNMQLFRYNLFMYKLCREYGISFVDTAFALRTGTGALKPEYCIDANTQGTHLSDAGCEALLAYLTRYIPRAVTLAEQEDK